MSEIELDTHAAHAAEYFWWTVRTDAHRQKLLMDDLLPRLNNDDEMAEFAFGLFDLDGDGFVVETEVQSRFQKMYRCEAVVGPDRTEWFKALQQRALLGAIKMVSLYTASNLIET